MPALWPRAADNGKNRRLEGATGKLDTQAQSLVLS